MSEAASSSSDITITVKGPSELKLSITISPSKNVSELKQIIAEKSDVEKGRQRLIYSGKVLKDEDPISQYKIQNGHTIHMVKGAAKPTDPSPSAPAAAPRLPQMGTGLNVAGNPIDSVENVHHGLAGFNPFAGVDGINNLNDPNAMAGMMQNPDFLRSMSEMMGRPEVIDQIIASNPQLAGMGPQIRQMMSNPMVRQMMSNPETLRMMMQMQGQMQGGNGAGLGGLGGMGGFGGLGGMNPFGALGGQPGTGTGAGAGTGTNATPSDPFPNLFAPNAAANTTTNPSGTTGTAGTAGTPASTLFPGWDTGIGPNGELDYMGSLLARARAGLIVPPNMFGEGAGGAGGGAGAGPGGFGGWGAPAATAPPRDTRPPEEIYAVQLGQLNGMGLWDAQQNIRALRMTGGNVEAAIELIFSGGAAEGARQ